MNLDIGSFDKEESYFDSFNSEQTKDKEFYYKYVVPAMEIVKHNIIVTDFTKDSKLSYAYTISDAAFDKIEPMFSKMMDFATILNEGGYIKKIYPSIKDCYNKLADADEWDSDEWTKGYRHKFVWQLWNQIYKLALTIILLPHGYLDWVVNINANHNLKAIGVNFKDWDSLRDSVKEQYQKILDDSKTNKGKYSLKSIGQEIDNINSCAAEQMEINYYRRVGQSLGESAMNLSVDTFNGDDENYFDTFSKADSEVKDIYENIVLPARKLLLDYNKACDEIDFTTFDVTKEFKSILDYLPDMLAFFDGSCRKYNLLGNNVIEYIKAVDYLYRDNCKDGIQWGGMYNQYYSLLFEILMYRVLEKYDKEWLINTLLTEPGLKELGGWHVEQIERKLWQKKFTDQQLISEFKNIMWYTLDSFKNQADYDIDESKYNPKNLINESVNLISDNSFSQEDNLNYFDEFNKNDNLARDLTEPGKKIIDKYFEALDGIDWSYNAPAMKFRAIIYFMPKLFGYFLKLVEYGYLSDKSFEFIKQMNVCFINEMKNGNKIRHIYSNRGLDNVEFNTYQSYFAILGELLIYEMNKIPGMKTWLIDRLQAEGETGEHYIEFLINGEDDFRGRNAEEYFKDDNVIELLKKECMKGVESWFETMNPVSESFDTDFNGDNNYFNTFERENNKERDKLLFYKEEAEKIIKTYNLNKKRWNEDTIGITEKHWRCNDGDGAYKLANRIYHLFDMTRKMILDPLEEEQSPIEDYMHLMDVLYEDKCGVDDVSYRFGWDEKDWRGQIYYKWILPALVEKGIKIILYPSLCSILSGGGLINNEEVQMQFQEIYNISDKAAAYIKDHGQTLEWEY